MKGSGIVLNFKEAFTLSFLQNELMFKINNMENLHDWINSILLVILGVAYFMQNNILKYMKTAMETINPKKIKQAQEFIDKGKEHEYKLITSIKVKEAIKEASKRFQDVNKDFIDQYNELLNIPFGIMSEKDWQFREKHLSHYPKNAEILRALLEAYDNGKFPYPEEKEN